MTELTGVEKIQTLVAQHELMVKVGADTRDPYPQLARARRQHPVLAAPTRSPTGRGVLALSHRVAVLASGEVTARLEGEDLTPPRIIDAAFHQDTRKQRMKRICRRK